MACPRPRLLIRHQRHRRNFARAMATLAVILQNRQHIFIERRRKSFVRRTLEPLCQAATRGQEHRPWRRESPVYSRAQKLQGQRPSLPRRYRFIGRPLVAEKTMIRRSENFDVHINLVLPRPERRQRPCRCSAVMFLSSPPQINSAGPCSFAARSSSPGAMPPP